MGRFLALPVPTAKDLMCKPAGTYARFPTLEKGKTVPPPAPVTLWGSPVTSILSWSLWTVVFLATAGAFLHIVPLLALRFLLLKAADPVLRLLTFDQLTFNFRANLSTTERFLASLFLHRQKDYPYLQYFFHLSLETAVVGVALWWPGLSTAQRAAIWLTALPFRTGFSPWTGNMPHMLAHAYSMKSKHIYKYPAMHFFAEYVAYPAQLFYYGGLWLNQHVYQHHKLNNSVEDPQTLMYFRRDSLINTIWFCVAEAMNHLLRLPWYHRERKSGRFLNALINQLVMLGAVGSILCIHDTWFACALLVHQLGTMMVLLLAVEFMQHGLINPEKPHEVMHNTTTFLKPDMQEEVNTGFGMHHEHSRNAMGSLMDETDAFKKNLHLYEDKAMVFDAYFVEVLWAIIRGDTATLAKKWYPIGEKSKGMDMRDREQMMADFLKPICTYEDIPWATMPTWPTNMMVF